jgi:mycothiol synthase
VTVVAGQDARVTIEPAPAWTIRRPTMADVAAILAVVHASDIAAVGEPDFTTEELVETLTGPAFDIDRDSWVALDPAGVIQGWAYLENPSRSARDSFEVYVHPGAGLTAQAPLFELALARVPERARHNGHDRVRVRVGAIASETDYVALLIGAGFSFVKRYARMGCALAGTETAPVPPAGVTIRPVDAGDEAELRAFFDLMKLAFEELPDPVQGDYDDFRAGLAAADHVPWGEWFVAEVDGVLAGALQSSDQGAGNGEGWVRKLAVAKEFRGRGLGALLLRTALAAYAARGLTSAGLGVDLTNPTGAYRIYQSVGLHPRYEVDIYERDLVALPAVALS